MIQQGFWETLPRPFFALAPMADVTDAAFRHIVARYGKPDVLFTEFVSCDGLCSEAREKLLRDLYFTESERPVVAQIFTASPEKAEQCARLIRDLKFDGMDINMGCPDRAVEKQGAGAALIKDPKRAQEIILAARKGAENLPVSVKTRIGYNKIEIEEWTSALLKARPAVIAFHLRTRKEMSRVRAHWDEASVAVQIARGTGTLIVGNGDVACMDEAREKAAMYQLDGIMIGRTALGNPWFFSKKSEVSIQKKLQGMARHAELFEKYFGNTATNRQLFHGHQKKFFIMRKHMGAYIKGFPGASALRTQLMSTKNSREVKYVVETFLKNRE